MTISSMGYTQSHLNDTILVDQSIHSGRLSNGFRYYILKPKDAGNIIGLRLIEKAGSSQSGKDEEGAAHLIEHLVYRSTKRYPQGVEKFMNSIGLTYAENSRASTGFDRTIYDLKMQTGDSALLNNCLNIMLDWADSESRLYLPDEVEQEKAAVLNELAQSNTSGNQGSFLLLGQNPLFTEKITQEINTTRIISREVLKRFDQAWYRPEMQAIIVVGDIDVQRVEKKIKSIFSTLKSGIASNKKSIDLKAYDVLLPGKNKLIIVNDGIGKTETTIKIFQMRKAIMATRNPVTISQLRTVLLDKVYNELVRQRLTELERPKGTKTFLHGLERRTIRSLAGIDALQTVVSVSDIKEAQAAILFATTELHRIQKWGFLPDEFVKAKKTVLNSISGQPAVSKLLGDLENYFMDNVPVPEDQAALSAQVLDKISLRDVNVMTSGWIAQDINVKVLITTPNEHDTNLPDQNQIFSWIRKGLHTPVNPYKPKVIKALPEFSDETKSSFVRSEVEALGAVQLEMSNGVKIIIKRLGSVDENPSGYVGDIVANGFRKGGTSLYTQQDYSSACIASDLIKASGTASLTNVELKDWFRERNQAGMLSVNPYMLYDQEGFYGQASMINADHLFHLIYLYATVPRADKIVFNEKFSNFGKPVVKSNESLLNDSIQYFTGRSHIPEPYGKPDFEKAFRIYKDRFSNASGFTFIITGYFETDSIIKKAARYLGAMPSSGKAVTQNPQLQNIVIVSGAEPDLHVTMIGDSVGNAEVKVLIMGNCQFTIKNQLIATLAMEVMSNVLFHRLREQEQGVYSVSTGMSLDESSDKLILRVAFDALPENVNRLAAAVRDEVDRIESGVLEDATFQNAFTSARTSVTGDLTNTNYVNNYLTTQYLKGTMSSDGLHRDEILTEITKQDIIDMIRKLNKGYGVFTLL